MEPVGLAAAVGGLSRVLRTTVEGTLEGWSDRGLSSLVADLKNRLTGADGLPANHDVARAIRTAQLRALHRTISGFADLQAARQSSLLHVSPAEPAGDLRPALELVYTGRPEEGWALFHDLLPPRTPQASKHTRRRCSPKANCWRHGDHR